MMKMMVKTRTMAMPIVYITVMTMVMVVNMTLTFKLMMGKLLIRPYTLMTLMLLTITMTMLIHEARRFVQAAHKAVHPRMMMMTTAVT